MRGARSIGIYPSTSSALKIGFRLALSRFIDLTASCISKSSYKHITNQVKCVKQQNHLGRATGNQHIDHPDPNLGQINLNVPIQENKETKPVCILSCSRK